LSLDLPVPAARSAGTPPRTRLGPLAAAALAEVRPFELQRFLDAGGDLFQVNLDHGSNIDAPRPVAADARSAEGLAEQVAEDAEDVVDSHAGEVVQTGTIEAGVPITVIALALLRVGEHLVGLGGLLEALLGVGCLVSVGVVLEGGLAVGPLDFLGR
jgi:hypothetical protein